MPGVLPIDITGGINVGYIFSSPDFRKNLKNDFSGNGVYQELSQITGLVISSVPNSILTTVCIGTPKVRA
jgi:hypothetical protein